MQLNARAWYARWYIHFWGGDLPKNFCPFFWKLLISIVTLPLTLVSIPFEAFFFQELDRPSLIEILFKRSLLGVIGGVILAVVCTSTVKAYQEGTLWQILLFIVLLIASIIAVLFLIGLSLSVKEKIVDWFRFRKGHEEYVAQVEGRIDEDGRIIPKNPGFFWMIGKWIRDYYKKRCPQVTWTGKDSELL